MCPPPPSHSITQAILDRYAINFALDRLEPWEVTEFLRDFRQGDLKSYPDFMAYLAEVETASSP